MKLRSYFLLIPLLLSLHYTASLFALSDEYPEQKELANLNQAADWQPTHDVKPLTDTDQGIKIVCTGSDPYILTNPLDFSANQYSVIQMEMKVTAGSQAQLFWSSEQSPAITEDQSKRFMVEVDGEFHTYTLRLKSHERWDGTIKRLRLDPLNTQGEVILRHFHIFNFGGADINVGPFNPQAPFVSLGETVKLNATVRNQGDAKGVVELKILSPSISVEESLKTITLEAESEQSLRWEIPGREEGLFPVQLEWEEKSKKDKAETTQRRLTTLVQISKLDKPRATLEARDWQAQFYAIEDEIGPIRLQIKQEDDWNDLAWIPRAGKLVVQCEDGTEQWLPITPKLHKKTEGSYHLRSRIEDRDGRTWSFSQDLVRHDSPKSALSIHSSIACDHPAEVLHFSGPELYIGEKSFGREKDLAIFPGVEYLDTAAVSSSTEAAHPPVRDHYMPHPYKVTIPLMALTYDHRLISMMWPPNASWAEGYHNPSPKFAVPNRLEKQENHLLGLFAPSVPDYVRENQEIAYKPFALEKDEAMVLESFIYITESNDPNDAVDAWNAFYHEGSLPDPLPEPRSYRESIEMSREAYMTTCWDEEEKGWGHCVGWSPYPSGGMLALLKMDQFLAVTPPNEELDNRIQTVYETILDRYGAKGLGNSAGCHVMTFEPAFFWGVSDFWLSSWHEEAQRHKQNQNEDGSWGFHIYREQQEGLGEEGEVVSGTISPTAMRLMRLARITADPVATQTGLKSLEALNRRSVPRGAQGWECPLASADIMVSAQAARANLDAYRITGEPAYLDYARYWARTGIGFHYLWYLQERPLQMYATIPIFGATFFTHTWRGVPVQWCGLVYAYALQELAVFDESHDWRKLAEGITTSALYQLLTEGPYVGTLPDSYGDYFLTAHGAYINPENIMTNLHALKGNSFNIRTAFVEERTPEATRISANADINDVKAKDGEIVFKVESKEGRLTEILIAPMEKAPKRVLNNQPSLPQRDSLFEQDYGWKYDSEHKALLIHVKHKNEKEAFVIETE